MTSKPILRMCRGRRVGCCGQFRLDGGSGAGRSREFCGPWRMGARHPVHHDHGFSVPAGPWPGPAGPGCRDPGDVSQHRHVSRVCANQGLGSAVEGAGQPGRFQVLVHGSPLAETFGTTGADWSWQAGGTVEIQDTDVPLALHDLTGFEGRCDAILFTKDLDQAPPNDGADAGGVASRSARIAERAHRERRLRPGRGGWRLRRHGVGHLRGPPGVPRGAACRIGRCWGATVRVKCACGPTDSLGAASSRGSERSWRNSPTAPRSSPGRAEEFGDDVKEKVVRAGAEHRPVPQLPCKPGRVGRHAHRRGPSARHAHGRPAALHGPAVCGLHGTRHHRFPGRCRLGHDSPAADGHEQHVAVGGGGPRRRLPGHALGPGPGDGGLPVPARQSRRVVLGKRIRQGSDWRRRRRSATGICGQSMGPSRR